MTNPALPSGKRKVSTASRTRTGERWKMRKKESDRQTEIQSKQKKKKAKKKCGKRRGRKGIEWKLPLAASPFTHPLSRSPARHIKSEQCLRIVRALFEPRTNPKSCESTSRGGWPFSNEKFSTLRTAGIWGDRCPSNFRGTSVFDLTAEKLRKHFFPEIYYPIISIHFIIRFWRITDSSSATL